MEVNEIIEIICFIYFLIGIIITIIADDYARKSNSEFFENVNLFFYIISFIISIIMWLPDLIEFMNSDNNDDETDKF